MRKIMLMFGMLVILPFLLMGCGNQGIDLDDIDIDAIDRFDVPAGTYVIQYSIEDISDLVKNHGAVVSFTVTNSDQEVITVSGNSFTVEANEVYTVVIKLTIGDVYKEKTITVTAVTLSSDVLVTFNLNGGQGSFPALTVARNSVLSALGTPTKDGFTFGGWYMDEALTTAYTNQEVANNVTLYAKWNEIVIATATVTFDLQGGSGSFSNQVVNMGEYALRPTGEPTKDGYIFSGWYVQSFEGQPFDFETMAIYQNTTVYAQWIENQQTTYTVTYDLNGAFQPEPITELVVEDGFPVGPTTSFIYADHIFIGWSLDELTETAMPLNEIIILGDTTLYAVWHIDFDVINDQVYTESHNFIQSSTLNEGYVEQRITLNAIMSLHAAETDYSINEDRIDYGLLYSTTEDTPRYYSQDTIRISKAFDTIESNATMLGTYLLSDPLLSDTNYAFVIYVRYETTIIYSPVFTYKTYIQVTEGTAVGVNYVVSGGYYKYDEENTNFRPSMFIEILDGYEATLDGNSYQSYDNLYREGIRRLIVTDLATDEQYLHVFDLDFQKPAISLVYTSLIEPDTSFVPQYRVTFPFDDVISYSVSEIGVLYSTHHPFLKLGIPQVSKKLGSLDHDDLYMITNSDISVSGDDVYIRGYAIINGKVSYSAQVTKLHMNTAEGNYVVVESIDIDSDKIDPEYGTSGHYTPAVMRVYYVEEDNTISYVDYPDQYEITAEGQYFIRNANGTGLIRDILIADDYPEVTGVEELGQYVSSVFITFDMFNPYWYYSLNDGEYVMLPAQVRLSEPGYYELFYRTGYGMEVIHFEIVTQATE